MHYLLMQAFDRNSSSSGCLLMISENKRKASEPKKTRKERSDKGQKRLKKQ